MGSCRQPGFGMALCRALGTRTMPSAAVDKCSGVGFCATPWTRLRGSCRDTAHSRLLFSCQAPAMQHAIGPPCSRGFADLEAWAAGRWQSRPSGSWLPLLFRESCPHLAPQASGLGTWFPCAWICTARGSFRRRGTAASSFALMFPPQTSGREVGKPTRNGTAWVLPIYGALGLGNFHFEYPQSFCSPILKCCFLFSGD